MAEKEAKYTEESIRTLEWNEHIRFRPGMYIGKLGDGLMGRIRAGEARSSPAHGIKAPHEHWVRLKGFGGGHVFDPVVFPKAVLVPESGETRLGRNSGAGQDCDCLKVRNGEAHFSVAPRNGFP